MTTLSAPPIWDLLPYPKGPWHPCREPSCNIEDCLACQGTPLLDPDENPISCEHQDQCHHGLSYGYRPLDVFVPSHQAVGDKSIEVVSEMIGRQVGKSTKKVASLWEALTMPDDGFGGPEVILGADTYAHVYLVWEEMEWQIAQSPFLNSIISMSNKNRLVMRLHPGKWNNGAVMYGLSGESPDSWSGFTASRVELDERQYIPDEAIQNIGPCLMARKAQTFQAGVCLLGENTQRWRSECLKAQEGEEGFLYVQAPSSVAPWNNKKWLEARRRRETEGTYDALYQAIWSKGSGGAFANIDALFDDRCVYHNPTKERVYVAGLDVSGEGKDATVLTVADAINGRIVLSKSYTGSITFKEAQVAEDAKLYKATVVCDATGMGQLWAAHLRKSGVSIINFTFNATSKAHLVQGLQRALEEERVTSPTNDILKHELQEYREQGITQGGIVQYGAPKGYHDDHVTALALCVYGLSDGRVRAKPKKRTATYA